MVLRKRDNEGFSESWMPTRLITERIREKTLGLRGIRRLYTESALNQEESREYIIEGQKPKIAKGPSFLHN